MPDSGATETNHSGSTLAIVLAALGGLFVATVYINNLSKREHHDIAARHFGSGEVAAAAGNIDDAVEEYRAAVTMDRDNLAYQQSLSRALFQKGSLAEARSYVRPLLERDPIDGATNLMMARILAREHDLPPRRGFAPPSLDQVEDYYRRAVYGQWPDNAPARRLAARLELIELLRGSGRKNQAVAELLALADETSDPDTQLRIANLLYGSGAARQSAELYRGLLKARPRDSDLYAGLARAEFEAGNYIAARDAFRNAIRWKPDNPELRQRLEVVNDIISLDPTDPRLRRGERMLRAERLLRRAMTLTEECSKPQAAESALTDLLQQASDFLDVRKRARDAEADQGFSLAVQIWAASREVCGSLEKRDEALSKVLARVENR